MAKRVYIPISDDSTECSLGYIIRYKETSSSDWLTLPQQVTIPVQSSLSPFAIEDVLIINNLSPSTSYDFELTRVCCDGTQSLVSTITFVTSA